MKLEQRLREVRQTSQMRVDVIDAQRICKFSMSSSNTFPFNHRWGDMKRMLTWVINETSC